MSSEATKPQQEAELRNTHRREQKNLGDNNKPGGERKPDNRGKPGSAEQRRPHKSQRRNKKNHSDESKAADLKQQLQQPKTLPEKSRTMKTMPSKSPSPVGHDSISVPAPSHSISVSSPQSTLPSVPIPNYDEKHIHIFKVINLYGNKKTQQAKTASKKPYNRTAKSKCTPPKQPKESTKPKKVQQSTSETLGVNNDEFQNWIEDQLKRTRALPGVKEVKQRSQVMTSASRNYQHIGDSWNFASSAQSRIEVTDPKEKKSKGPRGKPRQPKLTNDNLAKGTKDPNILSQDASQPTPTSGTQGICLWSAFTPPPNFHILEKRGTQRDKKSRVRQMFPKGLSRFLMLPRELRDMIYEYVVDISGIAKHVMKEEKAFHKGVLSIDQTDHVACRDLLYHLKQKYGKMDTPGILLANKQTHAEALGILRKRTLHFEAPAVSNPDIFPLTEMFSSGLLRGVQHISFQIPMRQHSDETMAGQLQKGSDWFDHSRLDNEALDKSEFWAAFILDCLDMLWKPGHRVRTITISIKGKDYVVDYVLQASPDIRDGLQTTIQNCLHSHNLHHFLDYLVYANISGTYLA